MGETNSLSGELLKQEGLTPGQGSSALLEQIQRIQLQAEKREKFWFRTACTFWIVSGVCFLVLAILGGVASRVDLSVESFPPTVAAPRSDAAATSRATEGSVHDQTHVALSPKMPDVGVRLRSFETYFEAHPIPMAFCAALMILPVAVFAGLFSSIWLILTRRRASYATLQTTVAALSEEIHSLVSRLEKNRA